MRLSPEQYRAMQARQRGADQVAGVKACAKVARLFSSEADILKAVLGTLELHKAVLWCARANSGLFEVEGRWVRAGFKGCSDVIGQMRPRPGERAGGWLAIETKSATGRLTADQQLFLDTVASGGGCAGVARSVDEVLALINTYAEGA